MTERPSSADRDRLLADTYHEDWTTGPASALAAHAAYTVRRRRTIRRLASAVAAVTLLVSGVWWLSFTTERRVPPSVRIVGSSHSIPSAHPESPARGYEIISDAELMSYLQDQSVMVFPDADGRTQVVWLRGG
jgi:hypothetical protein